LVLVPQQGKPESRIDLESSGNRHGGAVRAVALELILDAVTFTEWAEPCPPVTVRAAILDPSGLLHREALVSAVLVNHAAAHQDTLTRFNRVRPDLDGDLLTCARPSSGWRVRMIAPELHWGFLWV
jgi:hypothetical protein